MLVHSATYGEHIDALDKVLKRLVQQKNYFAKVFLWQQGISYLDVFLMEQGILLGTDKLKAVKNALPPANIHKVRQFLVLCSFFQCHVRNFAQLSAQLTALTKKECALNGSLLPSDAMQAF